MKSFIVRKWRRPVVLASLAASLLMGAISAPAWAASTDVIANTSPSAPITLRNIHLPLSGAISRYISSSPKIHDLIVQHVLSDPKVHNRVVQYLKDKYHLKSNISPVISVNPPGTPANGQKPSAPVGAPSMPSMPANGQNQSNPLGRVRYQIISGYGQNPSNISRVILLTPNTAIDPYGDLYTPGVEINPHATSTVYVLIY